MADLPDATAGETAGALFSAADESPASASPRRTRRYTDDFRRDAVAQAVASGARLADVAEQLDISASTLRRWVKELHDAEPAAANPTSQKPKTAKVSAAPKQRPAPQLSVVVEIEKNWPDWREFDWPTAPTAALTTPEPSPEPVAESAAEPTSKPVSKPAPQLAAEPTAAEPTDADPAAAPRKPSRVTTDHWSVLEAHPMLLLRDDIFPSLGKLLPIYRFPLILAALAGAVLISTRVPASYPLRPVVLSLHIISLVASFGSVLLIDWHGVLWLTGHRGITESTRLAAASGPMIWTGLFGLIITGSLLKPDLSSPLTVTKLLLVLLVAWNGAAMSMLRRRLAAMPHHLTPRQLPRREWLLMVGATTLSQIGWWGAAIIGFINSSR